MDTFKLKCASLLTRTFAKVDHVTKTHFLAGVIPINPFKISEAFPTVFFLLGSGCFIPHCVVLILLCKLCTCSCLLEATRKAASPEVHFEEFLRRFQGIFSAVR